MAKISQIIEKNEKKLYITRFLPESIIEKDENGEIKDIEYITIKKIPYSIKRKIDFLSMGSLSGEMGKEIFKKLKEKGLNYSDMQKMSEVEQAELILNMKLTNESAENMNKMTVELAQIILSNGVDKNKHTFFDDKGNPIELNYDFWETIGNEDLIKYVIKEIKSFSKGFSLGEKI